MPGVTATWACLPSAPTTVTWLVPDALVTIAATGTVSTGPSVRPVTTVTRTFSPFRAEASGPDGRTASGMNVVPLEPPELPELFELPEPLELPELSELPELADDGTLPMSTSVPVGTVTVAVP